MEDAEHGFTLQVSISDHGYYSTVSVRGVLDRVSGPVFAAHVDAALEWDDGPALIIEVGGVTFCDFDGVAAFATIIRRLRAGGRGRIILVGAQGQLQRMLRRTGLINDFEWRDSLERAGADMIGHPRPRMHGQMAPPGRAGGWTRSPRVG